MQRGNRHLQLHLQLYTVHICSSYNTVISMPFLYNQTKVSVADRCGASAQYVQVDGRGLC